MTSTDEKNQQIEALKWEIFEDLFHDTGSLVETINTLLENEMDKEWLVSALAKFFQRYELVSTKHAHPCEDEKLKLLADEAFKLHALISGSIYRKTLEEATAMAIEQVEESHANV